MPPQPLNIETSSMHFFSLSRDKIKHLGPTLLFNLFCAFGLCIQILQWFQGQDFVLFFFVVLLFFLGCLASLLFLLNSFCGFTTWLVLWLFLHCCLFLLHRYSFLLCYCLVVGWLFLLLVDSFRCWLVLMLLLFGFFCCCLVPFVVDSFYCYTIPFVVLFDFFFLLLDFSCCCSTL